MKLPALEIIKTLRPHNHEMPFCHHDDTQVIDTRISEEGDTIRRRRRCAHCDKTIHDL